MRSAAQAAAKPISTSGLPSLINYLHQRSASRQYLRGSNVPAWVTSRIVRSTGLSPVIGSVCNPVRRKRSILHTRTCNLRLLVGAPDYMQQFIACPLFHFVWPVDLALAQKIAFAPMRIEFVHKRRMRSRVRAAPTVSGPSAGASHTSRLVERRQGSSLPKHRTVSLCALPITPTRSLTIDQ